MKRSSREEKEDTSGVSQEGMSAEGAVYLPTLIFAGFAHLPAKASTLHGVSTLAVELEVDPYDMRVVDVGCNRLPPIGEKFLIRLLVETKIGNGIEHAIREIRARYFSTIQCAMITALEDALRCYAEFRKVKENRNSTS